MKALRVIAAALAAFGVITLIVWMCGSSNVETPGGYVGYVTQGAVFTQKHYVGTQVGPVSSGRTWMYHVVNVSVTPFSFDEEFQQSAGTSVLSKDEMQISFSVHTIFRIHPDGVKDFVEKFSTLAEDKENQSEKVVKDAYNNFLKERIRMYARDAVQKRGWQELIGNIGPIGEEVSKNVMKLTADTPFDVQNVVVGNIQFPANVSQAVAENQAQTQVNQKKMKEVDQAKLEAQRRVEEAKGIEEANRLIAGSLTPQYLQWYAIQCQKDSVNSPNHTVIYIPVGPMGVPVVGTFDAAGKK